MGKDFFSRKSKNDDFETPYSITHQLLENEKFFYGKTVDEPACGNNSIVRILKKAFNPCNVFSSDINKGKDFLKQPSRIKPDYIITNPPYSLWDEFVKKAKEVAKEKFAFLGRIEFLTGIARYNDRLYSDPEYPLTRILLFVRKVNLSFTEDYSALRKDGKYPAGMYHYAWFIFEKQKNMLNGFNEPIIKMINNQKYILRKNQ